MRTRLVWDTSAWKDYLWWQMQDKKVLTRINSLVADIIRNGNDGIGKPELLKHDFAGYWSRRMTDDHKLVYKLVSEELRIVSCRYHYGRRSPASRRLSHGREVSGDARRGGCAGPA